MNTKRRLTALVMALIMMFTLSGCTIVDIDFIKYGWDGIVNGIMIWVNPKRANLPPEENKSGNDKQSSEKSDNTADDSSKDDAESQDAENDNGSGNTNDSQGGSNGGNNGGSQGGNNGSPNSGDNGSQNSGYNGGSQGGNNGGSQGGNNGGSQGGNNGGSQGGNNGGSQGGNNGGSQGGNNGGSQGGNNGGSQGGNDSSSQGGNDSGSTEKTYTTEEAVNLYKSAANPVKSTSGYKVTRTREKYIELGGDLSGASAAIVKRAFSEKDDTSAKTYSSQSDIQKNFVVEKQSYVCNLTAADVKSATVTPSGDNLIIKIYVKDDVDQSQGYSNKAVSATAVSDLAVPLSLGKLKYMACKDVWLEATINASGQLINLHTYMPAYFYADKEYFAVALEQWWTISK